MTRVVINFCVKQFQARRWEAKTQVMVNNKSMVLLFVCLIHLESAPRQVGGRKGDNKTVGLVPNAGLRSLLHRGLQRDDGERVEGAGAKASSRGWCQRAHSFN